MITLNPSRRPSRRPSRWFVGRLLVVPLVLSGAVVALPAAAVASVAEAPAPATSLAATADFDEVKLTWSSSPTLGAETVVRGKAGIAAPINRNDGFAVTPADLSLLPTATASDLEPGQPYSFAVFACNGTECAAPATVTVDSYKIVGATVSPDRVTFGNEVKIRGQVVDAMTGVPVEYADVRLVAHSLTTDEVYLVAEDYARDGAGRFTLAVTPPEAADFVAFAIGDATHLAGFGLTRSVAVATAVYLQPKTIKTGPLGTTFALLGGADPIARNVPLVLQEKIGTKWKTLLRQKPNKRGVTTFKVTPATKGKHVYRVTKARTPGLEPGRSRQVTIKVT
ncbi:MAG TPA: hypothetical protein VNC22_19705 [Sporichthya sp.]|nr:hypothetical protein [Sporichthya sp.]